MKYQKALLVPAAIVLVIGGLVSSGVFGLKWSSIAGSISRYIPEQALTTPPLSAGREKVNVVSEESVVIDVVKKASPAVVTVGITQSGQQSYFQVNPFDPFAPFQQVPGNSQPQEQDIGSGFIVESDGLIITNKHVVSDTTAKYRIITATSKTYDVTKIYRDPANDLAILKIDASNLPTVVMGDSSKIQVGQLAIAIGTALGEFRSTVTTGVVSGLGRGITAGSPYEGYVERLDDVIQTSAAINPGNSGGPLLNSAGQVIGINTAVSQQGQNIGFAIPINVIKDALKNFNQTGQFNRPYLGVRFKMVTKDLAIMNDVPEGAYIVDVVTGSPAETAGIQNGDIITDIGGTRVSGTNDLAAIIGKTKVGQTLAVKLWRDGKTLTVSVTLGNQSSQ